MADHCDSCSWPCSCTFLEYDSDNCVIPEKSGYKSEEERNYADEHGYDAWKPCKYYRTWEQAIKILIDHIEREHIPLSPDVEARIKAVIDKHKQEQQP